MGPGAQEHRQFIQNLREQRPESTGTEASGQGGKCSRGSFGGSLLYFLLFFNPNIMLSLKKKKKRISRILYKLYLVACNRETESSYLLSTVLNTINIYRN